MAGNSRRYPTWDVGCHTVGRDERFLAAQESVLLQVPAAWFGDAWAAQSYGKNHAEVFFFGVLEKYNTESHKFTCRFEGDPKQYPTTWDTIFEFVVHSSMQWNSPPCRKSMQVSRSSVLVDSIPSIGESSHARGLEMLNLGIDDAHDAADLALDWTKFVCDVAEGASPDLEGKTHAHQGRGRPPKSRKRERPKGSSMHGKEQCTNPSLKYSRATRPPHKKKSTMHTGGRPSTSSSPFAVENGDDDNDEHASEGEGVECGDDEALESEGPVLDDTPDADLNFGGVVPLEGQSGDRMEEEPLDTFWSLRAFNGLVCIKFYGQPALFFVRVCGKFLFGGQSALFSCSQPAGFLLTSRYVLWAASLVIVCEKFYGSRVSYWWTAMSLFMLATGLLLLTGKRLMTSMRQVLWAISPLCFEIDVGSQVFFLWVDIPLLVVQQFPLDVSYLAMACY
ncbi:hypothetical protein L7F22_030828 [Adiantum nelumboides]|nr:hypothetical protein [Adiantum nelumboides]